MIIGAFVLGLILGVLLVVAAVAVYLKRQKAQALRPPESLGLDYSVYHTAPDPEPLKAPTVVQAAMQYLPVPYDWDGGITIGWDTHDHRSYGTVPGLHKDHSPVVEDDETP